MQKITVIIICYNSARTLPAALESVCNQTYQNLEILVIDDASRDRTYEIAETYGRQDTRIRIIRHSENKGILAARKTGIMAATGDFIMNLDGDDMYVPTACEHALAAMNTYQADFIQFGTHILPEGGISEAEILLKEEKLNVTSCLIDCNRETKEYAILDACYRAHKFTYTQWNKIYRADLLKEAYRFITNDQINMGEDMYCLFLITSLARRMAIIREPLYIYRFGQGISCINKADPMKAFRRSCETMQAVAAIAEYVKERNEEKELTQYVTGLRAEMLHRTLSRFYREVPEEERSNAEKMLRQWWTEEELAEYRELKKLLAA